jgi:hypothetical protein
MENSSRIPLPEVNGRTVGYIYQECMGKFKTSQGYHLTEEIEKDHSKKPLVDVSFLFTRGSFHPKLMNYCPNRLII